MRHPHLRLSVILAAAAGCGQIKIPKATPPEELPELAQLSRPAPAFSAATRDSAEIGLADLKGKPAVVVGCDWQFAGDALRWREAIEKRLGAPGGRYTVLLVVEGARLDVLRKLEELIVGEMPFGASGDFRDLFGFVGEGPHVAVISPDGVLLALADGTASPDRVATITTALDRALVESGS